MLPHLLASSLRRTEYPSSTPLHPEGLPELNRVSPLGLLDSTGCDDQNGHGFCGMPHSNSRRAPQCGASLPFWKSCPGVTSHCIKTFNIPCERGIQVSDKPGYSVHCWLTVSARLMPVTHRKPFSPCKRYGHLARDSIHINPCGRARLGNAPVSSLKGQRNVD